VLLALAGCMFLLRRMTALRGANGSHLRVIEALALGARERLVLLDVDGERVLIGVSAGRIQALAALKPAAAASFEGELKKSLAGLKEAAR
jgi:flagellar biosynthetic protein FliO